MRTTLEATRAGPEPAISLRPTPRCEPPFDDELEPSFWATAHQLSLNWSPRRPPAPGEPASELPQHSPVAGASAEAKLAVRRFVRTCVEVLDGHRPAAHLRRLSRPMEASAVVAQGVAAAHRVRELREAGRTPGRRAPSRPSPVAVMHVRLCEPRPGAVEAAVALLTAGRTWALALRLEVHEADWRATTLHLV
ncbi:Rv3235 family protein [Actinoplanes sp. Pm04-4]|uniref:Rv3235 family protein n=1 Tax=Paractinoplanes pyxinae TaxID=2997416 RepID=A0ABT4B8V6_9ACTN|nr:Rv3235 family protein [Actinoplanes pyxinae]MCY1142891.1 Rv3235 family protein [Actinoplanes pyxinae]